MSKFFNETRKAMDTASPSLQPVAREIDVQQLVGAVREGLARPTPKAGGTDLKPLLRSTDRQDIASQVAVGRLENCSQVTLPREDQKSFLARQYNADLQAAVEAYRTLRTRLVKKQAKQGMRSFAVTSTAQGEGKTLTALNLALCYSHLPDRAVLLVDGDLRTKGLSNLLELQQHAGVGDILEVRCNYESAILRTDFPNLYVLPAGHNSAPAPELFSLAGWKSFVAWCGETFQMTLIDSPPVLDLADTELILSACEGILIVTRAGTTKGQALAKVLDQVDAKKLAGVVFNGCQEAALKNYYRHSYGTVGQSQSLEQ